MAEVNAFSIDGTKYQLTATDQTYVGETGLAQLGLDYTCTPDEMNQALADAGGGTVLVNGSELYSAGADGWDFGQDSAEEVATAQGVVCMRSTGVAHRSRLWLYGRTDTAGIRTRGTTAGEDATYDGTEWAILMYGYGDEYVTTGFTYLVGQTGTSSGATVQLGLTLPAPVAPGVDSASVTSVGGTAYIRYLDGSSQGITKASAFDAYIVGPGELRLDISGADYGDASTMCMARLFGGFTIEFS